MNKSLFQEKLSRYAKLLDKDKKLTDNELIHLLFIKFGFPNEREAPSIIYLGDDGIVKVRLRLPPSSKEEYSHSEIKRELKKLVSNDDYNIILQTENIAKSFKNIDNNKYWYPHIVSNKVESRELIRIIRSISSNYDL